MTMTKIAEGVDAAIYSDMVRDPVQTNALIVIGDEGVCVVVAHYTPSAARATIAEIRTLTRAIVPGHGPVQRDRTWLHRHVERLESLIAQVDAALKQGLSLDETRIQYKS